MKISDYFTISALTAGLSTSLSGSWWLYSAYFGLDSHLLNTFFGLLFVYLLLNTKSLPNWFWSGFFIGLFWFWWIGVSFYYYNMSWASPIALLVIGAVYGLIFWFVGYVSQLVLKWCCKDTTLYSLIPLTIKVILLLSISYLHPLGFDWFKPELVFVHSYIGITKWQLGIVMLASTIAIWRKYPTFLLLSVLAYSPIHTSVTNDDPTHTFKLASTNIAIKDKWDTSQKQKHIDETLDAIDKAIDNHYKVVVLPESIMPFFVNKDPSILGALISRSRKIDIIIGALYWDDGVQRNSTYLFQDGRYKVANKVVLVPFGESNPLPDWASRIVNKLFFDGAVDYIASANITDWEILGGKYRNAICYEGTSEKLYVDNPRNMIIISNNGWFYPSIEPLFQRLLIEYYVKKYDTKVLHAANMSDGYIIQTTNRANLDKIQSR